MAKVKWIIVIKKQKAMKITKIHIEDYKIFKNFTIDFTFNSKLQNLIIVAGINGSGKTTLLEHIKATFSESIYFKANKQNVENADKIIIEFIDKLIYEQKLSAEVAYSKVNNILNDVFSEFNLHLHFDGLDRKKQVFFTNSEKKKLQIKDLSSGEKELLTKIFSLYISDIKDSLILIDEPENSLHPIWQNRIAPIYQRFAEQNNNQIILATHSPHIVGSVRKEQLRVLIKDTDTIKVIDTFDGSYGWQIERILLSIFRTKETRTLEIEKKLSRLHDLIITDNFSNSECINLQKELEEIIGFDDNELVLLRIEIAKKKREKY